MQTLQPAPDTGLNGSETLALAVLAEIGPATSGQWHAATSAKKGKPVPQKTFQNWRTALVAADVVEQVSEESHTYQVTAKGKEVANGTLSKVA